MFSDIKNLRANLQRPQTYSCTFIVPIDYNIPWCPFPQGHNMMPLSVIEFNNAVIAGIRTGTHSHLTASFIYVLQKSYRI